MRSTKKFVQTLHKDNKETLVQVDDKLYRLVLAEISFEQIQKMSTKEAPHVRFLNPIPERTAEEQASHNTEIELLDNLAKQCRPMKKTISLKDAAKHGIDIPKEVEKLLELKQSAKTTEERKKIRKQLRKLNYKRYREE
jgi:hypothetical protein